eukprot:TRINITY_DN46_c0_g1_i2.p2 TRINITY_DN46_c0_g1~~TRINITY_DN46_c0_g1_i2.p2  ORF type:complete len:223 (+),score=12.93 TRINITY_DN46_c0_g1_i2:670-1338(+)
MKLSVWNITSGLKIWSTTEKIIASFNSIGFNEDMLTMIGNSDVYNGTQYLYSINQCQIRNILSSPLFPLKFQLPNIIANGTQNYEYAFVLPFTHPSLSQYVGVSQFKNNQPAAPLPLLIVNTQTGYITKTVNLDFGENELTIFCKTLYSSSMMIACTDNYNFKIFNASSATSTLEPLYTLQIPTAPLQQQNSWDVNSEGTIIYFTTSNNTYSWTFGSTLQFQ